MSKTAAHFSKAMPTIEIEDNLMTEICEAAKLEEKSCSEYINDALLATVKKYRRDKKIAEKYAETYQRFPQELAESEEEFAKWKEIFERSEK